MLNYYLPFPIQLFTRALPDAAVFVIAAGNKISSVTAGSACVCGVKTLFHFTFLIAQAFSLMNSCAFRHGNPPFQQGIIRFCHPAFQTSV